MWKPLQEKTQLEGEVIMLSLSLNGNGCMYKEVRLVVCGPYNTQTLYVFYISIHSKLLLSYMEQNALKYNETSFPPSGSIITHPNSLLVVKFDPFNS